MEVLQYLSITLYVIQTNLWTYTYYNMFANLALWPGSPPLLRADEFRNVRCRFKFTSGYVMFGRCESARGRVRSLDTFYNSADELLS